MKVAVKSSYELFIQTPFNRPENYPLDQAISPRPARASKTIRSTPADIDNLIVASCTGVDTPGLDVKIAEAMGMSPYLRLWIIVNRRRQGWHDKLGRTVVIYDWQVRRRP